MNRMLILFSLLFSAMASYAQQKPVLISAQWLNEHLKDPNVVVLQVNFLRLDYEREHIPNAGFLWPEWLAPNSPEGSFNAPDPAKATQFLQGLGVNKDSHVILCHTRTDVSVAARLFLTLEHLGLQGQVSFLNGGLEAWKKEGFPVSKELPRTTKGNFIARPGNLLVDKTYVLKTLQSDKGLVVDARMKRFYDGEPTGNPRDGHISGAKNIPYTELFDSQTGAFKPLDSLQRHFVPVAKPEQELVTYCFIGQTASVVYMAGRMLGYNMKLYDGSIQEWSRIDALPMEKTEK
ncbi:MAG TPA: rhodanese-like domain-containing protein [Chryseosolibacter sp.]|nr:rhodanese-like domain-containing protein [Chryseosolibacter sp.]